MIEPWVHRVGDRVLEEPADRLVVVDIHERSRGGDLLGLGHRSNVDRRSRDNLVHDRLRIKLPGQHVELGAGDRVEDGDLALMRVTIGERLVVGDGDDLVSMRTFGDPVLEAVDELGCESHGGDPFKGSVVWEGR